MIGIQTIETDLSEIEVVTYDHEVNIVSMKMLALYVIVCIYIHWDINVTC